MKFLIMIVAGLILSFESIANVAVIVNKSNPAQLTQDQISRIFLGKSKTFDGSVSATAINLPEGNGTRTQFDQQVLGKSPSQLKAYWSKLLFTGKGSPPKELGSDQAVINKVANTPGAIGYIKADQVNDTVKVIATF